ncbi:MAG: inositol monophosphatase family protein [Jatrophihabitans sp.]
MSEPDAGTLLRMAEDVAREAGELILTRRRAGVSLAGTKSSATDVVTDADRESEQLIRARLLGARPDDAMLGEEGGGTAGTSGVTWVVDPIDGTVNYLYDLPQYAVSIAAEVAGEAIAGVVHNPADGETWAAAIGSGARLDGDLITVSGQHDLAQSLVGTGFGYAIDRRAAQARTLQHVIVRVRDIRRGGSAAIDLCNVACGRLDAHYERGLNPWDRAAGALIAREAGALVGGLHGTPESDDLTITATPGIFAALHDLLAESGADAD